MTISSKQLTTGCSKAFLEQSALSGIVPSVLTPWQDKGYNVDEEDEEEEKYEANMNNIWSETICNLVSCK